jgi:hypothetical protein
MSVGPVGGTVVSGWHRAECAFTAEEREYLLLGSIQLAGVVPQDMPNAGIAFLSDVGGPRDDDGRMAPRDGDAR